MSSLSECLGYGLAEDDAAALESKDDVFYGNDELEHHATESSTEITSDGEEVQERTFRYGRVTVSSF
jgi:hypothetical protein